MAPIEELERIAPNLAEEAASPPGVHVELLQEDEPLPLVVRPAAGPLDLLTWSQTHRKWIEGRLLRHGGILFRGFQVDGVEAFTAFIEATTSGDWADYREAATPRRSVSAKISTSTEYPAERRIYLHNENSHCTSWPLKIHFYCERPAARGGETPIADCRRVLSGISSEVRQRFAEKGWMYIRNFGHGLGFDWRRVFGADDREGVEAYCRANGMETEWLEGERLRVRYRRSAIQAHPKTGELVWFNHGTFFHSSTLEPEIREILLAEYREEDLAYHTRYGDGSPIEPTVMDHLRASYDRCTVVFPWEEGDILTLDNMLVAHGRRPFEGDRRVLVGMVEPYAPGQAAAAG